MSADADTRLLLPRRRASLSVIAASSGDALYIVASSLYAREFTRSSTTLSWREWNMAPTCTRAHLSRLPPARRGNRRSHGHRRRATAPSGGVADFSYSHARRSGDAERSAACTRGITINKFMLSAAVATRSSAMAHQRAARSRDAAGWAIVSW